MADRCGPAVTAHPPPIFGWHRFHLGYPGTMPERKSRLRKRPASSPAREIKRLAAGFHLEDKAGFLFRRRYAREPALPEADWADGDYTASVRRSADAFYGPDDPGGRTAELSLSDAGMRILMNTIRAAEAVQDELLEPLPPEYRLIFLKCLRLLADADAGDETLE
jgi:hypothetical protein